MDEKASLYLLYTVALLEKLLRPKPSLLQLFDGRLKLAASGGGRVNLLGGQRCQRALGGVLSVFLESVGWKADMNRLGRGVYCRTNVDIMPRKSVAAKLSQTRRSRP